MFFHFEKNNNNFIQKSKEGQGPRYINGIQIFDNKYMNSMEVVLAAPSMLMYRRTHYLDDECE